MSHHEANPQEVPYNEVEADGNSKADTFAMLGVVLTIVAMAVFFASR